MNSWEHKSFTKKLSRINWENKKISAMRSRKKSVNLKKKERKKLSKTSIARKMRKYF